MSHILVPLDGSTLAAAVVQPVLDLDPTQVTLLHVTDAAGPPPVEAVFAAWADRACRTRVQRARRPAEGILAAAAEVGATVIALSSHGRTGLNRLVLGSVAEEVVRASPLPVLLVRAAAPSRGPLLARALVGHDGSERASRGLEALALLARGRAASATVAGILDVAPIEPGAADPLMEALVARQRGALLEELTRAAARARGLGLEASPLVREGRPATALLELAEELAASLLVVATRGRSRLVRWILGSVAEELLHTSSAPLLVVR